jgi:3-hydroxybutyryl-CoA dehydratase
MLNSEMSFNTANIKTIKVGMTASCMQTISDLDIKTFASLSGDNNPVHMSDEYASKSRYKKRIAHGLLSAGFFSSLFGTRLPGAGCVYISQTLNFKRPVYIDSTVMASIEVISIDKDKKRVKFSTICKVNKKIVIDGVAEIFIPE